MRIYAAIAALVLLVFVAPEAKACPPALAGGFSSYSAGACGGVPALLPAPVSYGGFGGVNIGIGRGFGGGFFAGGRFGGRFGGGFRGGRVAFRGRF